MIALTHKIHQLSVIGVLFVLFSSCSTVTHYERVVISINSGDSSYIATDTLEYNSKYGMLFETKVDSIIRLIEYKEELNPDSTASLLFLEDISDKDWIKLDTVGYPKENLVKLMVVNDSPRFVFAAMFFGLDTLFDGGVVKLFKDSEGLYLKDKDQEKRVLTLVQDSSFNNTYYNCLGGNYGCYEGDTTIWIGKKKVNCYKQTLYPSHYYLHRPGPIDLVPFPDYTSPFRIQYYDKKRLIPIKQEGFKYKCFRNHCDTTLKVTSFRKISILPKLVSNKKYKCL